MVGPSLQELEADVKLHGAPSHVGVIMDGNGRWAELRGKPRLEGHREGSTSVREVTRSARRMGVKALTLYAFSAQNWERPKDEVAGLMDLLCEYLEKERDEILQNGIRLNAIGAVARLPRFVREPLEALRADSARNQEMVLTLALSYGAREELVQAAARLAEKVKEGTLDPRGLCEQDFENELQTRDLPPVDLIIRTSGELRLSNFLLWQAAYAELIFVDQLWPEFRAEAFAQCLREFQRRERRFGRTSAQVRKA